MRVGSMFSGYGGLDMGVTAAVGGTVAWHAEIDPHASQVLEARFPDVPNLGDVSTVDWSTVEPVDVLCGGFPCQDVSTAGARAGLRDGTRSGLWAAMAHAVDQLRPRLVVVENVRGLLSACAHSDLEPCPGCVGDGPHDPVLRALGRVLGDLADLGFDAEWGVLSAASVGACHRRERVFIVGWPASDADASASSTGHTGRGRSHGQGEADRAGRRGASSPADADGDGHRTGRPRWGRYAAAIARHELLAGRPAPEPRDNGRLSARFVEWMMTLPDGWVTDVLPRRPALRCLGNGVVPVQAEAAVVALLARSGQLVAS